MTQALAMDGQTKSLHDVSRLLTQTHALLPILLLCSLVGLAVVGGPFFDRVTPGLFWLWIGGTPVIGIAALIVSKQRSKRGWIIVNYTLLSVWALGLAGTLLLH